MTAVIPARFESFVNTVAQSFGPFASSMFDVDGKEMVSAVLDGKDPRTSVSGDNGTGPGFGHGFGCGVPDDIASWIGVISAAIATYRSLREVFEGRPRHDVRA